MPFLQALCEGLFYKSQCDFIVVKIQSVRLEGWFTTDPLFYNYDFFFPGGLIISISGIAVV